MKLNQAIDPAYFDSLGFYVYGYRDPLSARYVYIGMGQGARVIQHLTEDKDTLHPEFARYLGELYEDDIHPYSVIDIMMHSLESKRTAESHEAQLIQEHNPRLNRSPGNVRGSVFSGQPLINSVEAYEVSKWTSGKELERLLRDHGPQYICGNALIYKGTGKLQLSTPVINGYSVVVTWTRGDSEVSVRGPEEMVSQILLDLEPIGAEHQITDVEINGKPGKQYIAKLTAIWQEKHSLDLLLSRCTAIETQEDTNASR